MYLEKLKIQGFKSFANKNTLVFPGMLTKDKRGITSVVGPNGSGKSNVADAVRWALGEQSMKTLRGKKSQDIIFSGSDPKGSLGMAEVSLILNNEDRQAEIDYSQVVVTRRLYRNGDSEYMINNNRVRLADIQMMLAKAKFGQKTYSVIGQGMVEGFLNTSLAERKEFFDEATGVKQFQIKRDDSLNKLRASYENLIQAQMLITEIEPRLKSLTRQVNRLHKRDELETKLKKIQTEYYSLLWHDINNKFSNYNKDFLALEKEKIAKDKKLAQLNRELEQIEQDGQQSDEFIELEEELSQAQVKKDEINNKLSKLEAQLEVKLETNGKFDLSFLINKKEEIEREIEVVQEEISHQKNKVAVCQETDKELYHQKDRIDQQLNDLNSRLSKISSENGNGHLDKYKEKLAKVLLEIKGLDQETDLNKIKVAIQQIASKIEDVINQSQGETEKNGDVDKQWQEIHEQTKKLTIQKEEQLTKINENNLRISARSERVKLLEEKIRDTQEEVKEIEVKIKQNSGSINIQELTDQHKGLKQQLHDQLEVIKDIKEKIHRVNLKKEKQRSQLFSLQKDLQQLQNEINMVSNQLNELRVNSTRYETKLEDLEIEIREELGGLKDVKNNGNQEQVDLVKQKQEIQQIKRQLELIGGIDPEIEKEYNETKERFDFLSGQVNDLTQAVSSLEKVIKELDVIIKERFDKEFKQIAGNFEKYFKILFSGGNAKIIKVMEDQKVKEEKEAEQVEGDPSTSSGQENRPVKKDDHMEIADLKKIKFLQKHNATGLAGIEIQASPPGKKINTITMLSGGERALTAIALICAIISSNPSPFVFLDEVDAALDEANSERLAKILDELSHKTQFIVITHNRATMRRANILYGVTMGDDGVSKLLSIKLDEASKHFK